MRAFEFLAPLEVKLARAGGELTGYGSTFGNRDHGGDIVAPGAFAISRAPGRRLYARDVVEPRHRRARWRLA